MGAISDLWNKVFGKRKFVYRFISKPGAEKVIVKFAPGAKIKLRDGRMPLVCLSVGDFEDLMLDCRQMDPDYISEKFDCDDSGDTFMGDMKRGWAEEYSGNEALAFGWIHLKFKGADSTHWMNWMIDDEYNLNLVEPQRDALRSGEVERIYEVTQ